MSEKRHPPPSLAGKLLFAARHFEEIISCAGMSIIIVVVTLNVLLRYFLSKSIPWAEEVAVIGFSCVIFIGSAAVYKRHMHVGIDFLVGLAPRPVQAVINYLTGVFLLVFNGYITYLAWIYSVESWDKPTSILFIPYFFVNIPICIGFASMSVYALLDLVRRHRHWYSARVTQRAERRDA